MSALPMRKSTLARALAVGLLLSGPVAAQTYSKTEAIAYHDNTSRWVLGQTAAVTDVSTGLVQSSTTFDPTTALPVTTSSFGKLQSAMTYNADGTLASVKDGRNNTTTLSNWKRGIPQTVTYADGTSQSATVDDNGWITSVTNAMSARTCYAYDAMGRQSQVTYPSESQIGVCDSSTWAPTTRAFVQVNSNEYGIPAGHWRQSVSTGNARTHTYFDALWRPLMTETYDQGDVNNTLSRTVQRYDASGRIEFQSYPLRFMSDYAAVTQGIWTLYDALDRPTSVSQDSELGLLTTTTEYLSGFQTRVTNPRGLKTTTSQYLAYDQPTYEWPLSMSAPEGAFTTIARDVFGKPSSLTRSGPGVGPVVRTYAYNGFQELCRSEEPETGATLYAYDAAGNLASSEAGVPLGTSCGTANGRTVSRTYDARNRLSGLFFPDGNGNQTWTYHADGLPSQVTTWNDGGANTVINHYAYNRRGLLIHERKEQPWFNWSINYTYDANGFKSSQSYPDGWNTFDFVHNALGQLTQVGGFALNIRYHPNGAISSFTYGNGIVHTMAQNARLLPSRSTDSGASSPVHSGYSYDANGNVTQITEDIAGGHNRQMTYDGLDRLTATGSTVFGGDGWHRFTYDAVDNIKSWKLPGVKDYANYVYDPSNRLTNIQNSAGASIVGLGYDVQGNLANKNGQTYAFDFGNRLRNVAGKESYRYDAAGRRIFASTNGDTSGTIGSMYSRAGELVYEWNGREGKQVAHLYLNGSPLLNLERIWATGALLIRYQHTDALGTPVAVTDEYGQIVERTHYDPYGGVIGKPVAQGVGYTGHVMDAQTGLNYMQQRYYDPNIGRFLSVDPVTANSGTGANFNRYWYANNNPYKFTDPDGRVAIITKMKDGSIQVDFPAKFSGTGASDKNISAVKSQVEGLSGTYKVGGKDTQVNFRVSEITKDTPRAARNSITLTEGPTERPNGRSAAEVGGQKAWIDATDRPVRNGTSAHEFLHLADNKDRYNTATGLPDPAKGNNIMNTVPGVPDSTNIQEMMDSRKNIFRNEGN